MANSIASSYSDALEAQRKELEGYASSSIKAITIPAQKQELDSKDALLKDSGWLMIGIGVVGIIIGIVIKESGVILAGIAALVCGGYCYVKSIQLGRQRAFSTEAERLRTRLDAISADISSRWNKFIAGQNNNLTRDIISSNAGNDAKVAMVENIKTAPMNIDMDSTSKVIDIAVKSEQTEDFAKGLDNYLSAVSNALQDAGKNQRDIYNAVDSANK